MKEAIDQLIEETGKTKLGLIDYLDMQPPNFYRKLRANTFRISEMERMAQFFDVPVSNLINHNHTFSKVVNRKTPITKIDTIQNDNTISSSKEIEYLKKIVELQEFKIRVLEEKG